MVLSCSKTTPSACFRCRKSNAFSIMYVKGPANGNVINKKGSKRPLVEERLVINTMFIFSLDCQVVYAVILFIVFCDAILFECICHGWYSAKILFIVTLCIKLSYLWFIIIDPHLKCYFSAGYLITHFVMYYLNSWVICVDFLLHTEVLHNIVVVTNEQPVDWLRSLFLLLLLL